MNIYDYLEEWGIYSFEERTFNEVDAVIFSFLSYANFHPIFEEREEISLQEAGRIHIGSDIPTKKNIIAVKEANKLLRYMKDTKRYKDCKLFHYEYIANDDVQFGAISIEYLKNQVFVSFEGTDETISGWKENFILSYEFPTKSHKLAISYLNKHYLFSLKKLMIGGHSKGGNLALVSSMYASFPVRTKIKKVYNADGPGLLEKEFLSKKYQKIKPQYQHIIPSDCFIGLLLHHSNDVVVKSDHRGILSHNIVYWKIDKNHFIKAELSPFSKKLDQELREWFASYHEEDKKEFIQNLEDLMIRSNIQNIIDVETNKKKLFTLIKESKEMSEKTKQITKDFILLLIQCFGHTKKEEMKKFMSNIFQFKRKDEENE